eukprot:TRINITY_DN56_c0_g1_i7.p2 TRINITY_DN56_c0_g1~~TRINITY_DN56_c0_g1_i7.p2  ORF type:complete len:143 (+),score=7.06 TRINITY_DN56_c0_g1_i7:164-592(+)
MLAEYPKHSVSASHIALTSPLPFQAYFGSEPSGRVHFPSPKSSYEPVASLALDFKARPSGNLLCFSDVLPPRTTVTQTKARAPRRASAPQTALRLFGVCTVASALLESLSCSCTFADEYVDLFPACCVPSFRIAANRSRTGF